MADDIQQLPVIATPPLMRVDAVDSDSRSSGDGHLRDQPGKKARNKKHAAQQPAADQVSPAPIVVNPSVLLQDEVNLTHSARTVMGEQLPPLSPPAEPLPEENPPGQPPAPVPEHIHFTA